MLRSAGACFMLLLGMLTPPLLSAMRDSFSSDELNDEIMTLDVDHPDQEPISNLETNSNSDGDAAEADDAAIHSVEEDSTEGGGRQVVILLDVDGVINIDVWVEKQPIGEVQVLTEDQRLQINKDGHLEWVDYGGKEDIDGVMADDPHLTEKDAIDFLREIDESQRTDAKYHFAVQSRTVPDDDGRKYSDLLARDMVPNHDLVERLADIIKSAGPDVQVVLSSTWRKRPEKAANLEKVIEAALDNGKQFKFSTFTGEDVFGPSGRFEEVGNWLAEYCKKSGTRGWRHRSKKLSVVMLDDIHANGWEELKHYSLNKIELKDQKAAEAYLMTHVPDDQKDSVSVTFVHTFESFKDAELGRVRVGRGLTGSKYTQALNAVNPDAKDAAAANTLPSSSIGSGSRSGRKSTDSGLGSTEKAESPDLRSSSTPVKVKTPLVDVKSTGSTDSVPGSEAAPQKKEVSTSSDAQTVMLGPEGGRKKAATVGATVYSKKQVTTNDDRTIDPIESGTVAAVREGQFDVEYSVRGAGAGRKAKHEKFTATVLEKDYANWRVLQAAPTVPSQLTRSASQKTGSDDKTPVKKSNVRSLSEGTDAEKIMVKGELVYVGVSKVYVNKYKGKEYPETGMMKVKVMSVITDPSGGKVLLVGTARERIPPPYDAVVKVVKVDE